MFRRRRLAAWQGSWEGIMGKRLLVFAVAMAFAGVALGAGCGGGGSAKLTDDEIGKLGSALSDVTGYCVAQIRGQAGQGTGGELGNLNAAVSTAIDLYKKHKDESFALGAATGAPKTTMKAFMRTLETQLGTGGCAPDQAQRIEQAVSG
jgi:hypothetical protein